MRPFCLTIILLLAALHAGAQDSPAGPLPSVELPAELARVLRDYEAAWVGRDPAALASLFTEEGFVLANGKPPVRGRAAIREAYANAGGPLSLRALAWSFEGTTGYIIGGYGASKDVADDGKFILALRKVDGKWLIDADMDNSNRRQE